MKTIVTTLVLTVLLLTAGGVGFIYSGLFNVSAAAPHGAVMTWILETTMHASVERRAEGIEVPDLNEEPLLLAGINDFQAMCVQCHGAPGREPDAVGKGLSPPAPDLSESAAEMTVAELFWITKYGIRMTGMPAWGETHEDDALWPVVAFVTTLPELDAEEYAETLKRAEGMGHHSNGTAGGAPHAGEDPREHEESHDPAATATEEDGEAEHDHSGHEH